MLGSTQKAQGSSGKFYYTLALFIFAYTIGSLGKLNKNPRGLGSTLG